jgi:serine/threonine protein kinase/TfoX/Sxy family transcriptional regulator of competence genes
MSAGARLTRLGRYEVLSELGKGAMGIVYLAKDPVIGRMVAIKTIRASQMGDDDSESREFRERFIREAQTAGILSHPNIVTIHDIGEDPDTSTSFIAMEYIEGKNLKSLLSERAAFSYDQIAEMIAQVAEAIDYAHRKGIIHRDIKPANIIITTDEKVKITDFGIAKVASSNLTTTGQFLGTPNYMSPEQVSGAPVDGRSDIFSLGVVLYELLTHRKPFVGENLTAISYKIVHEDFTPPAELSSEVPAEFNPIVARAMAKDPWNRYQRGKDFALALHQLRAHLEEQRALQDLGTIVSAAEFMPTLRLANMDQLILEGAEEAKAQAAAPAAAGDTSAASSSPSTSSSKRTTEVPPPPPAEEVTRAIRMSDAAIAPPPETLELAEDVVEPSAGAAARTTGAAAAVAEASPSVTSTVAATNITATRPATAEGTTARIRRMLGRRQTSSASLPGSPAPPITPVPGTGVRPSTGQTPTLSPTGAGAGAASTPGTTPGPISIQRVRVQPKDSSRGKRPPLTATLKSKAAELAAADWKAIGKSHVNPRWVWRMIAATVLFFGLILGALVVRRAMVSKPTATLDPALEQETKERRQTLEEGKRLFASGKYEESLALFRKLLARSPNNAQARQYAQMAENALQGRQEQAKKTAEADQALQEARAAFDSGDFATAKKRADDVLALDGGRVEAQQLREQAAGKIADADAAKRKLKPTPAPVRRAQAAPAPEQRVERPATQTAPAPGPPAPAATGSAMLRLLFESPVTEGHVMVAVNDQILLRKQFSFKRKEGLFKTVKDRGTVDESIPVKAGAAAVKVWLSGPDIPASLLATTTAQLNGGETRTLRLDYSNGRLSVRVQ